ncbi:hypothetical protein [Streptomyces sp. NPDC004629]|uniref:hypothetical protein n=1 Tax=Streptomyces sp. NPDC004629 TaxID=3364705 RepID=UPI00369147A6
MARLTGTTVSSLHISTLLAELTRRPDSADVLHALILLADHLDTHGSPLPEPHPVTESVERLHLVGVCQFNG